MAITVNNPQAFRSASNGTSYYFMGSDYTAIAGLLVVRVFAQSAANTSFSLSASWDGDPIPPIASKEHTSPNRWYRSAIFALEVEAATKPIQVTSTQTLTGVIIEASVLTGLAASPVGQIAQETVDNTQPIALPLTGLTSGSLVLAIVGSVSQGPPTWSWTNAAEDFDLAHASSALTEPAATGAHADISGSSLTITATRSAAAHQVGVAVEFLADSELEPIEASAALTQAPNTLSATAIEPAPPTPPGATFSVDGQGAGTRADDKQAAYLRVYDRASNLKHAWLEPISLRWTHEENSDAPAVFVLPASHPALSGENAIEEFDIVEVLYKNNHYGYTGYRPAFHGIVRDFYLFDDSDGIDHIEITAYHINHIISWAVGAWPAGTANRSAFAAMAGGEIIERALKSNIGSEATEANGRYLPGYLLDTMDMRLTVNSGAGKGATLTTTAHGGNLLSTIQRIAEASGIVFNVKWLGQEDGKSSFEIDISENDDSDKSASIVISKDFGTLLNPRLRLKSDRATIAVSAGQGEGSSRDVSIVTGNGYGLGTKHLEAFADSRNEATGDGRESAGLSKLVELRGGGELDMAVFETGDAFYFPVNISGLNTFAVSDLIRVDYAGSHTRRVKSVSVVSAAPGGGAGGSAVTVSVNTVPA